jgi:enoyl-[acyl-carrier-protein] reductase (NADH)
MLSERIEQTLNAAHARVTRMAAEHELDDIARTFDLAQSATGGNLDILVHVTTETGNADLPAPAGYQQPGSVSKLIDSCFFYCTEFARRCIAAESSGSIVLLVPSAQLGADRVIVSTAVGALENLVKTLAVEWGRVGIRTNAIASFAVEKFAAATVAQQTSLANLTAYLASDYAAYVTGCVMGIDEIESCAVGPVSGGASDS